MSNLKKKVVAVAILALTGTVSAGTMGPICVPSNVTVPCEKTAWEFGAKALYLEPMAGGDLQYYAANTTTYFNGTSTNYLSTSPDWAWGFMIEGAYNFGTGNDVNLNWYHYQHTTTNWASPTTFALATPIVSNPTNALNGYSSYDPRWDAVNLEFGQHVDFGVMTDIRFHAGFEYARVRNNLSSVSKSTAFAVNQAAAVDETITFNGFGPRFGADADYDFGNGFTVYGNSAMALLAGSGGVTKFTTFNNLASSSQFVANHFGSVNMFVPELEGKLGATYTYAMAQGDLTLDAGWMWIEYFDAVPHSATASGTATTAGVVNPTGTFTGTGSINANASNFALTGPYVGLKWLGNV